MTVFLLQTLLLIASEVQQRLCFGRFAMKWLYNSYILSDRNLIVRDYFRRTNRGMGGFFVWAIEPIRQSFGENCVEEGQNEQATSNDTTRPRPDCQMCDDDNGRIEKERLGHILR